MDRILRRDENHLAGEYFDTPTSYPLTFERMT